MKKITYLALMLMIASLVFSCKKKDPEPSPRQKIIGKWRMISGSTTVGGITTPAEACELDNITEFKTGDIYTIDEGPTKCEPTDPQTTTGPYSLNEAGTLLNITETTIGISVAFEVLELTTTRLRIRANNVLGLGITAEYSYEKMP
ncbi:MAG: hypothetical protein Fur0027_20560 [Raineya sp.]